MKRTNGSITFCHLNHRVQITSIRSCCTRSCTNWQRDSSAVRLLTRCQSGDRRRLMVMCEMPMFDRPFSKIDRSIVWLIWPIRCVWWTEYADYVHQVARCKNTTFSYGNVQLIFSQTERRLGQPNKRTKDVPKLSRHVRKTTAPHEPALKSSSSFVDYFNSLCAFVVVLVESSNEPFSTVDGVRNKGVVLMRHDWREREVI